jgi:hypothetical protein
MRPEGLGQFKKKNPSYRYLNPRPSGLQHYYYYYYYLVCEAIGTAATPGLLCQPRVIMKMIVETQMECRLAEETEVLGENLSQLHFCTSQNPQLALTLTGGF